PSTLAYFTKRAQGITRMTLSLDDFNETPVLLPPLNEQKQIAMRLSDIDKTIERVENSISFSQQIKQELINKVF
ncbi:MAG: restriction endonuclease subunit S, partial [Bacteroidales bacterium]|nr:restriction endonuclease subunit S [Bacteroidales bacterium]